MYFTKAQIFERKYHFKNWKNHHWQLLWLFRGLKI